MEEYKKLVSDNITKVYKKDESNMIKETNQRAKDIAVRLDIDDRVDQFINQMHMSLSKATNPTSRPRLNADLSILRNLT